MTDDKVEQWLRSWEGEVELLQKVHETQSHNLNWLNNEWKKVDAKLQKAKEALEFYAKGSEEEFGCGCCIGDTSVIGQRARKALEEIG